MTETIYVKYFNDDIPRLRKIEQGDWIDLCAAADVTLFPGESALIPLGVGMILPNGYEAHIVPRSSTFKKFGVIQANHCGIIDNSYCGDNDQWMFSAYALKEAYIKKGDRICQFRIIKKQPEVSFVEVAHLKEKDRGGFGSTGTAQLDGQMTIEELLGSDSIAHAKDA